MKDHDDARPFDVRLPPYVKDLLEAERDAPPPPRALEDRVRARVAATVVVAGAAGLAGTAGATTVAGATAKAAGVGVLGSTLGVKTTLIVVAIAAGATATATGMYVIHERRPQPLVRTAASIPPPTTRRAVAAGEPLAPPVAAAPVPVPAPVLDPPVVAAASVASIVARDSHPRAVKRPAGDVDPAQSPTGLVDENVPIAAALAALARGAPDQAIDALERHARRFPAGQLEQEREALWIQALVAGGDADRARARADRFRRRFPGSIQEEAIAAALAKISR